MDKTDQKSKTKVILVQDSPPVRDVTLVEKGIKVSFSASCREPKHHGTGNTWEVAVYDIVSEKDGTDIKPFLQAHELCGILRYDLMDWCRENLHVEMQTENIS